jgi:membrane protease YdiL (CAAX protease family)
VSQTFLRLSLKHAERIVFYEMTIHSENVPAVILMILSAFILISWVMVGFPSLALNHTTAFTVAVIYTVLLIFTFLIFIVKALAPQIPLDFIDLGDPEKAWLNLGIGTVMGVFVAVSLMAGAAVQPAAMAFTIATPIAFFFIVLVAPIVEELFFRGALLPTFTLYLSKPVGLFLSSLLFALYHVATWGAVGLIGYLIPFLFALLLGLLTVKFESVAPAIITHMTANLILAITSQTPAATVKLVMEALL